MIETMEQQKSSQPVPLDHWLTLVQTSNLLDALEEAVLAIQSDFSIDYANAAAQRLLGYTADKFKTLHFNDFLSQDWSYDILHDALLRPLETQALSQFESVDMKTAGGQVVTMRVSLAKWGDEAPGYLVVLSDLTAIAQASEIIERTVAERTREAETSGAALLAAINSLDLGFVVTNAAPEVVTVNVAAHQLFCKHGKHNVATCHEVTLAVIQAALPGEIKLTEAVRQCLTSQQPRSFEHIMLARKQWQLDISPVTVRDMPTGCVLAFQPLKA